jgi:hypothetical protein
MISHCRSLILAALLVPGMPADSTLAADLQATYVFDGTLSPIESGRPSLVGVDPLGRNLFENVMVDGQLRSTYHWIGNAVPATQQAGLSLNTSGLISRNNYSVEMVFEFLEHQDLWRRVLDVRNRQSDNGFYVDFANHLNLFPKDSGTGVFTNNQFHHVVLTDASNGVVNAYLDGRLEFSVLSHEMDINNPQNLMNFFLDNVVGGFEDEYANGRIALLRVYEGVLTGNEVADLAHDPFANLVPEPSTLLLFGIGLVGPFVCSRWRKQV